MHLRSAGEPDAVAVSEVWRSSIRTICAPAYRFDESVLVPWADSKTPECVSELIRCEEFFVVAEEFSKICGFFCATFDLGSFALYVAPECQGQGIGSRLFRCYENLARASDRKVLSFHSTLNAVTFYQKLGAVISGEPLSKPRPCIPMRKEL